MGNVRHRNYALVLASIQTMDRRRFGLVWYVWLPDKQLYLAIWNTADGVQQLHPNASDQVNVSPTDAHNNVPMISLIKQPMPLTPGIIRLFSSIINLRSPAGSVIHAPGKGDI